MDIHNPPSGKIVNLPTGYRAYVPDPLPPTFDWSNSLANALSRADFLLGRLAREGEKLPNPHLLIRPFVAREAVLSSKIEGTRTTIGEILAHNAGVSLNDRGDDLQEVQNYIDALDFGLKRLGELPLSLRLIREIHEKLMQGARGSHATPGEFRKSQNWIGVPGCTLKTAKFVPPPVDCLTECLGAWETFLYDRELPDLVHTALCHYQFEAIHPFLDGNGRIGRLMIIFLLIERKILPSPLLYISAFFENNRDEYYKQLFNVSSKGSWNEWLIYFLNGVATQSEDALSRTERINDLLESWKKKVNGKGSPILVEIIERFAVNPYLSINKIAGELGVAYSTAKRGVDTLISNKIIQQIGDNKRGKVYCATDILSILEEKAAT